jgi:DNA replication and repair protein RecF
MAIKSIRTAAFRNLADAEVFTRGKDIFLVGENGQGKTNFLEALYFSSYASSFRGARDGELARTGERDFSVFVQFDNSIHDDVLIKCERGRKTILIDEKKAGDRQDLLSVAPCIVFCHEDMEFVAGSPERRRWFFDQSQSLCDPEYLDDLRRYRRVLKTRNTLLKDNQGSIWGHGDTLDALDRQLAAYGLKLMEKRETAAGLFSGVFGPLYEEVSGLDGIAVQYHSSWKEKKAEDIQRKLLEKREADRAAGITLSGPHRDRYTFTRREEEFAAKASTGQRRLLALLLRIAQARRFSNMTGRQPIFLLDDVLLEMDGEKRRKFLSLMPDYEQAFFTFLPDEPYGRYRKEDTVVYAVQEGLVQ